jgi:hypothetical protein
VSRNADKINRDIERVNTTVSRLTPTVVTDLVRRAGKEESPQISGASLGVKRGTHSDPTAGAVINKIMTRGAQDPVYQAGKMLALHVSQMADHAQLAEECARFILDIKDRAKDAEIAHCGACGREVACTASDRLRSGYCSKCYTAWIRAGRPPRLQFEISVRNAQNDVQVSGDRTTVRLVS